MYPTRCNVTHFVLSGNCSTCFGWYHHPTSGAQTTVYTTSGICHTVISVCRYRGTVGTGLSVLWVAYATHSTLKPFPPLPRQQQIAVTAWQIPDAVDTVFCAPDDGWWYHPKHVEQFPDKINCVTLHLVGYILLEYLYYNSSMVSVLCLVLFVYYTIFFSLNSAGNCEPQHNGIASIKTTNTGSIPEV